MYKLLLLYVILVATSGYLYLKNFKATKYVVLNFNGYHIFYSSLISGIKNLLIAAALYYLGTLITLKSTLIYDILSKEYGSIEPAVFTSAFIIFLSFPVAKYRAKLANKLIFKAIAVRINNIRSSAPSESTSITRTDGDKEQPDYRENLRTKELQPSIELALRAKSETDTKIIISIKSIVHKRLVLLTLQSERCYVGYISTLFFAEHTSDTKGLILTPIASGFRDENKCLKITTNYLTSMKWEQSNDEKTPFEEYKLNSELEKFQIAFSMGDVTSVAFFNPNLYGYFKNQEKEYIDKHGLNSRN